MELYGAFANEPVFCLGAIFIACCLAYFGLPIIFWSTLLAVYLAGIGAGPISWALFGVFFLLFNIPFFRARLVSLPVMKAIKYLKIMPRISETERVALEAGKVWIEREFFCGKPNFKKIMNEPYPELSKEEKEFLDGPCEELCLMADDFKAWQDKDLSPEVWEFLKKKKFFGMIIPKKYGGLEFSGLGHSTVIKKLSSRSLPLAVTGMVPNSLGPAELLIHYGTEEQKNYYLPRLAIGDEIPCFALTEPGAGSDAGGIQSSGVLFKKDGKYFIKLNWNKRYITLASISTVLGLAFKLKDPENFLGKGEEVGITCALIPSNTKGVILGRRHDPLCCPFYNCPTQGQDVEIPADYIIGGIDFAGKGWQMLMESLAAGRGISLPAQNAGGSFLAATYTGAYAAIRRQFNMSIGKFEGIQEPLSRIAGYAYLMEAGRKFTCGAIDAGIQPPIITAVMKYQCTELGRKIITDAMDIVGGAGISRGPKNVLGHMWMATPIGITVEGANILTRTLIIFGQGLMRAHPTVFQEVDSIDKGDYVRFDKAFFTHIGLIVQNFVRAVWLSWTRAYFVIPFKFNGMARYYQKLTWASATFAFMSDTAMGTMGGKLKTSEMLTGRFADALSWIYLATSVLRRFEAEGCPKEQRPLVHWCMQTSLYNIQCAFTGIFSNFYVPVIGWLFRHPIKIWGKMNTLHEQNNDLNNMKIARLIQKPGKVRDLFKDGIFVPSAKHPNETLRKLEEAFNAHWESEAVQKKVRQAIKEKKLPKKSVAKLMDEALQKGIITSEEFGKLKRAEELRDEVIQVDSFPVGSHENSRQLKSVQMHN